MSLLTLGTELHDQVEKIKGVIPSETQIYLAGGAVRDILINRPIHDLDFVILNGDVLSLSRKVADELDAAYFPLDPVRQTARVITRSHKDISVFDFSAPRGVDIESDLLARDFTINAMAIDLYKPMKLIDPLSGAKDLHERILRVCSSTSLLDDPIRVVRAIRLAIDFNLRMIPETKELIHQAKFELNIISAERQRDELFHILEGYKPALGIRLMDFFGILEILLPELVELKGLQQPKPHVYDGWYHTLAVAEKLIEVLGVLEPEYDPESAANWALGMVSLRVGRFREKITHYITETLSPERSIRGLLFLAALYHDAGKPQTLEMDSDGKPHFYKHEIVSEDLINHRSLRLRLSNKETRFLKTIVRDHMRPFYLAQTRRQPSKRAVYRFLRDCGNAGIGICILSLADALATYGPMMPKDVWIAHLDTIRPILSEYSVATGAKLKTESFLNGSDVIKHFNLSPGPQIGDLLEALKEAQYTGDIKNRQEAINFAQEWLDNGN